MFLYKKIISTSLNSRGVDVHIIFKPVNAKEWNKRIFCLFDLTPPVSKVQVSFRISQPFFDILVLSSFLIT